MDRMESPTSRYESPSLSALEGRGVGCVVGGGSGAVGKHSSGSGDGGDGAGNDSQWSLWEGGDDVAGEVAETEFRYFNQR